MMDAVAGDTLDERVELDYMKAIKRLFLMLLIQSELIALLFMIEHKKHSRVW